jgi:hypothetical protein
LKKKWFVATIVLKCEVAGEPSTPDEWTCTQQVIVLKSEDRDVAYEKALRIGKSLETSYLNVNGKEVLWEFIGLENLEELPTMVIKDGTEIWGRIFHTNSPDNLVVEKSGLAVFYENEIKNLKAKEIINEGQETKLICNRIRM